MSGSSLIDELRLHLNAKSDAVLARELEVAPPVISKLRGGMPLGSTMLIRIHERTGWPVQHIRDLAGQPAPQQ
jgi:hypothetical protein